jgi:ADP-ribosyltransferase exoenzyme
VRRQGDAAYRRGRYVRVRAAIVVRVRASYDSDEQRRFVRWLDTSGQSSQQSLREYATFSASVNDGLRGLRPPLDQNVTRLRAAFDEAPTIKGVVYRGVPRTVINRHFPELRWRKTRGRLRRRELVVVEAGFLSTSAERKIARKFSKKGRWRGRIFEISVHEPRRAILLSESLEMYQAEREVLFPPGSKMRVHRMTWRRVICELLPTDEPG